MRILIFLLTVFYTMVMAANNIQGDYIFYCYQYDRDNNQYRLVNNPNSDIATYYSVDQIADKLVNEIAGIPGKLNYFDDSIGKGAVRRHCDRAELRTQYKTEVKSRNSTIDYMTKMKKTRSEVDYIALNEKDINYFVGFNSKNFGIGTAYIIRKNIKHDQTKGVNSVTYSIENVNFRKFFIDNIYEYCKKFNSPPVMIMNTFSFINRMYFLGDALDIFDGSLEEDELKKFTKFIDENNGQTKNADVYKSSGMVIPPKDVCEDILYLVNYVDDFPSSSVLTPVLSGGDIPDPHGWYTGGKFKFPDNDDERLFRHGGWVINYPYVSFPYIDEIFGGFFSTIMEKNNIERGIFFTDKLIEHKMKSWKSGKWPNKKINVSVDFDINTSSYDVALSSIVSPFQEFQFNTDWDAAKLNYTTVINIFPSTSDKFMQFTPVGHSSTHVFREGGEIWKQADIGTYHAQYYKKKRYFNLLLFILVVLVVIVVSVFTFGIGFGGALGSGLIVAPVQSGLILGAFGTSAVLSWAGVAGAAMVGSIIGNDLASKGSKVYSLNPSQYIESYQNYVKEIVRDDLETVYKSGSMQLTSLSIIPKILQNAEPITYVKPKLYKTMLKEANETINEVEWDKNWGTTGHYVIYTYKKPSKKITLYDERAAKRTYDVILYSMFMDYPRYDYHPHKEDEDKGLFNSKKLLRTLMLREWRE